MADQWTPPPNGTPCWINIDASDVRRGPFVAASAKKFYASVFNWTFKEQAENSKYPPDNIAFFTPPDPKASPPGAISKAEVVGPRKGGVYFYLYVDDLAESMKKVEAAGGKKLSEIEPESDMGLMQHFEDTEGNYFGMYTVKK